MEKKITVRAIESASGKETIVYLSRGENLLDALVNSLHSISSECQGMGTCGKCSIRGVEGALEITSQDRVIFSALELERGYRLACMAYPDKDCTIMLSSRIGNDYKVVTEVLSHPTDKVSSTKVALSPTHESTYENITYAIAIDLGTTTLAIALVALPSGDILDKYTAINPQKVYGADVVARIKA